MPLVIVQTSEGSTGWAGADIARFAAIKVFVDALETDINGFPNELKNLTTAEIQQLENIGAVTINGNQWGYLGDLDQALHTGASVEFLDLTLSAPSNFWSMTDARYFTQAEVLDMIAGNLFDFWPSDTADGVIGGYNKMFDADTGEAMSHIGPTEIDADPVLLQAFITEIGQPTFTVLSTGLYSLNVHAATSVGANVKAAQLSWKLYKRTQPGGVETLLLSSETSTDLTITNTHYEIHASLTTEQVIDATDRLVLKVYGERTGAEPTNPDVTFYMEGTTATRLGIRTTLAAFDERYLRINGGNAMLAALNMNAQDITNAGDITVGNGKLVGLDAGGHLLFIDAATDQIRIIDAQLQILGGKTFLVDGGAGVSTLVDINQISCTGGSFYVSTQTAGKDLLLRSGAGVTALTLDSAQHAKFSTVRSGATQAAAGAAATELWRTNGHASLPDNVLMIGV